MFEACEGSLRIEAVLLVPRGGRWSLVEGVIWAVHQRVLAEHCCHICSGVRGNDSLGEVWSWWEEVKWFVVYCKKLLKVDADFLPHVSAKF